MDDDHRLGGQGGLDGGLIGGEPVGLDIDQHRRRADVVHRLERRDEGVGRQHDAIAAADAEPGQGEHQRIGARAGPARVRDAEIGRDLALEGGGLRTVEQVHFLQSLGPRRLHLAGNLGVFTGEVEKRDTLAHHSMASCGMRGSLSWAGDSMP